ncbi:MAG TPA: hypothetical protein VE398_13715 [Acidobacteriota bacterium]|nr:hypothetical protein [Acidobacteriota bacterium]
MSLRSEDTHPDAEKVQLELLRQATISQRLTLAFSLSQTVIDLAKRAIRRRYPKESEQEILVRFVSLHYSQELAGRLAADLSRRSR